MRLFLMVLALGGCASNSDVIVGSSTMPTTDNENVAGTPAPTVTSTPARTSEATAERER